jgi:hypothetical protein
VEVNTYLYVIASAEHGPCKIGYSINPEKRLKQLQTGHAHPLKLWFAQAVPNHEARRIERQIHCTIGHLRTKGEWFSVSVNDATTEVQVGLMSALD